MVESRKGPRHSEHVSRPQPKRAKAAEPAVEPRAEQTEQLVVTLNAATHEIIEIETLNKSGQRQQLSEQQRAELTAGEDADQLVAAVQEAYEAGVAAALGTEDEDH